jgi:hypothetical protein
VNQCDLGEYEENAREKQRDTNIKENHKLSLKQSHKDGKHQAPPAKKQNEKNRGFW